MLGKHVPASHWFLFGSPSNISDRSRYLRSWMFSSIPMPSKKFFMALFTPRTISGLDLTFNAAAGATSVTLQCSVAGAPSRVTLEPAWQPMGGDLDLRDDGVAPDKVAGDKIYTLSVPLTKLVVAPDDVFRPFLGFLTLRNGTTVVIRYNLFLSIAAPDIPRMTITDDGPGIRRTAYVFNIVAPEAFPTAQNPAQLANFTTVTQKFYQHFADNYDFLNIAWLSPPFFLP